MLETILSIIFPKSLHSKLVNDTLSAQGSQVDKNHLVIYSDVGAIRRSTATKFTFLPHKRNYRFKRRRGTSDIHVSPQLRQPFAKQRQQEGERGGRRMADDVPREHSSGSYRELSGSLVRPRSPSDLILHSRKPSKFRTSARPFHVVHARIPQAIRKFPRISPVSSAQLREGLL